MATLSVEKVPEETYEARVNRLYGIENPSRRQYSRSRTGHFEGQCAPATAENQPGRDERTRATTVLLGTLVEQP